jgi:hypothetical protein
MDIFGNDNIAFHDNMPVFVLVVLLILQITKAIYRPETKKI